MAAIPGFGEVHALYESARYLDIWRITEPLWQDRTLLQQLDARGLTLAARVAHRLGNSRYYRVMLELSRERFPGDPYVEYYTQSLRDRRSSLLDTLLELEALDLSAIKDADLRAGWLGSHAFMLARVRDFKRAHEKMKQAYDCGEARAYVRSLDAQVLLFEDRWDESLARAQEAWRTAPGQPYAADALMQAYGALGRHREALDLLLTYVREGGQCGQCLEIALFVGSNIAERLPPDEQKAMTVELVAEIDRLPGFFPLADRFCKLTEQRLRLMLAYSGGDRETVLKLAPQIDAPFYRTVAANITANPQGRRVLLPHHPVRQRHNTCLPASLAAITSNSGPELDQDAVSAAISFEGTAWWRARDYLREHGFTVRCFVFTAQAATALLDLGIPFMISFASLKEGHACAVVGYDAATCTALVHDPSTGQLIEMLLKGLEQSEAPLGPACMLVMRQAQAALVQGMKLPQETAEESLHDMLRALETKGAGAALAGAPKAGTDSDPVARYVHAQALSLGAGLSNSADVFIKLLAEHPQCVQLQRRVLGAVEQMGDTALQRSMLHSIVTRAPLPGIQGSESWIYPEPHLLAQYANLLMMDDSQLHEAERWLRKALRRGPLDAETYFNLGNLRLQENRNAEALLPFRIASLLEPGSDSAAEVYATELYRQGHTDQAVAWLEARVKQYAAGVGGAGPWMALVDRLEHFGRPEQALAELKRAREQRPADGELAAFAVSFFSHYGRKADADAAQADARKHAPTQAAFSAEVRRSTSEGRLADALEVARRWHKEAPLSRPASEHVLRLTDALEGPDAALKLAEEWHAAAPKNDAIEEMLLERLRATTRAAERVALLRNRVERNPHDAWAWRELAIELEGSASASSKSKHTRRVTEFTDALKRCIAGSPEHTITLQLRAEHAVISGKTPLAIKLLVRSIDADPARTGPLARALELCRAEPATGRQVLKRYAAAVSRLRGQMEHAPAAAAIIAANFGRETALECLADWAAAAPGDPHITQARAEITIERGGGIDALLTIVPELEQAVARFPIHVGLREALARCYSMMLRYADAALQLEELLKFAAHHMFAYVLLAETYERMDQPAKAEAVLRRAVARNPLEHSSYHALADLLVRMGRVPEAEQALGEGCHKLPTIMNLHERRIGMRLQIRDFAGAEQISSELAAAFPEGAYAQLVRARTLRELPEAGRAETEAQYQRALELNTELWDAVDEYADYLCNQAQFIAARKLLTDRRRYFTDPVALDFKLIELERRERPKPDQASRVAALLKTRPDFAVGWRMFIQWVEEDNLGRLARQVLPLMPPNLGEDVGLQCDKLELLLRAGEPLPTIEKEWWQLISNMPDSMEVNLRWFDILMEHKRLDDAESVLEVFAQHGADTAQFLCRRVAVHCARKKKEPALEAAEKLWLFRGGEAGRSAYYAFHALQEAKLQDPAAARLFDLHRGGAQVMSAALEIALDFARKPKVVRELVETSVTRPADASRDQLIGSALARLTDLNDHVWVMSFGDRHADLAQSSAPVWQAIGYAYLRRGNDAKAAQWLSDWRGRPGVEMWAVNVAVGAHVDTGQFAPALADGVEALQVLEHDHTAPVLARNTLLAGWLIGDTEAFRDHFERFSFLLGLSQEMAGAAAALSLCYELLSAQGREIGRLDNRFRDLVLRGEVVVGGPMLKAWEKVARSKLSGFGRFWYRLKNLRLG